MVFAVYDMKAAQYGMPMFMTTRGLATRGFVDACGKAESMLNQHPEDYFLYEIGEYDQSSGKLKAHKMPEQLMAAADCVVVVPPVVPVEPTKEVVPNV